MSGCRCAACSKANSAHAWALRHAAQKGDCLPGIISINAESFPYCGRKSVPKSVLLEALKKMGPRILLESLLIMRLKEANDDERKCK